MIADERALIAVVEGSAIVKAIERAGARFRQAAIRSAALAALRSSTSEVGRHAGAAILIAVLTHVLLVGAIVRPAFVYWLFLPSLFAVIGGLLLVMSPPRPRSE